MRLRVAVLAAAAAVGLGTPGRAHAAPTLAEFGSFSSPMYVTAPPGDTRSVLVVERAGRLRLVEDGATNPSSFADISARVRSDGERGLLSAALRPDYAQSGMLYVYYSDRSTGDIVIEELRRDPANPRRADPAYHRTVLRIPHRDYPNHNGGQIAFGGDGYLYAAPGDGGGADDPLGNAQRTNRLLGKLLRIDPRAGNGCGGGCTIPPDNPFASGGGAPEVWAYGLRNPWRFSFDRATGDLVIADVGQSAWEEINVARASTGGGRGANYGWPCAEGTAKNTATACPVPANHTPPVIQKPIPDWVSITGGVVVRDPNVPSLAGRLLFTDYSHGSTDPMLAAQLGVDDGVDTGLTSSTVTSISEDGCARAYVTSMGGAVRRVVEGSGACAGAAAVPPPFAGASRADYSLQPPPPAAPVEAGVDRIAPTIALKYGRRQRTLRSGRLTLLARCNELCRLHVTTRVQPGRKRVGVVRRTLAGNARVRVTIRLSRKLRRALRRDTRRGTRVTARVTLRATDPAGNARSRTVRVRLKR